MGPSYVPRLMTTTWGRRLMGTPLLGGAVSAFAKAYAGIVGAELRKYGLRYEDVIVVTPDVDTAIRRMEVEDPAAVELRNKRLKRAMDLGLKHTYMPAEMQAAHDPWADSMTRYIAEAKRERLEAQGVFAERPPKSDSPAFFTR